MADPQQNFIDSLRMLVPINGLPSQYQDQLFKEAQVIKLKKKEIVFAQGSRDDFSYYLLEGTIEMYANDQFIKQVEGGTGAAFHPLAQLQPRQMTAKAKTPVTVLRVNRMLMDRLLSLGHDTPAASGGIEAAEISGESGSDDWMTILLQSELFMRIPPSNIQRLLATMQPVEFKAGDIVVKQDDPGDYYYVIKSGRCEVCRKTSKGTSEIRLAELGTGVSFGEEALVSGSKRNATVRMLTDGELGRLTKDDFIELIKKPLLKTMTFEQARAQVKEGGGIWLDVRFPEEYQQGHLADSMNIPLNVLRTQADKLDSSKSYVAYCDTGSRSCVAAFLLTQRGLDASYLESGCLRHINPLPVKPTAAASNKPAPAAVPGKPATTASVKSATSPAKATPKVEPPAVPVTPAVVRQAAASVDAEVRASALRTEVAKADLQLEEAERLKAEANRQAAEPAAQAKLRAERDRIEAEAKRAAEIMAEAKRLKEQLENEKRQAEAEAERLRQEHESKLQKLKAAAEDRLKAEEARLQEMYRAKAEEIEALQKQKNQAESQLDADRKKLAEETTEARKTLAAVKKQLEAQQEQERKLRETSQSQLAEERRKLEAEFARNNAMLELIKQEKKAAEAARHAASEEAEAIIAEHKSKFEQMRAQEEARMAAERRALEAERERLLRAAEATAQARTEAEKSQHEAEKRVAQLREQRAHTDEPMTVAAAKHLRAEIEKHEARAAAAGERLRVAIINEETLQAEKLENERNFLLHSTMNKAVLEQLERELQEWSDEQDRQESSTVGRDTLARMQQQVARINEKAQKAKKESESHDENLLNELASVIGDNDD
ncbi:MAG TPA: cyclic nucleotide-binding domain-containing protein [Gammaproteobacteria bacterium]|nr:cyclic nucleotide-binding domain-containing protein [Gammaproteobacteria bacterium]